MDVPLQQFGSDWTSSKLERVKAYLDAYVKILKGRHYTFSYVDAFAGTGYVHAKATDVIPDPEVYLETDTRMLLEGSANLALNVEPQFHNYVFIERSPARFIELSKLKSTRPSLSHKIHIHKDDANSFLLNYCATTDWSSNRAVVFLDPFGMQVDWSTIEAIASTKAIDMWYLFPLSVTRLMRNDGNIKPEWAAALDRVLGPDSNWYQRCFQQRRVTNLFDTYDETVKTIDTQGLTDLLVERLRTVFPHEGVAPNPLCMSNSKNSPLYLLCFATANIHAAGPAVRIADHLLKPEFTVK